MSGAELAGSECELCAADRLTEWFYDDDLCWIAECEQCAVPMAVWKRHDPNPPQRVRVVLKALLGTVVDSHYGFEPAGETGSRFDSRLSTCSCRP